VQTYLTQRLRRLFVELYQKEPNLGKKPHVYQQVVGYTNCGFHTRKGNSVVKATDVCNKKPSQWS
jgi:hypothetical protein